MKVYLTHNSAFTFRGKASGELDLLGKSCIEHMAEHLGAEPGEPEGEEYVLLDPVYPFLSREALFCYLEGREGSYFFPGGRIMRRGYPLSHTPRMTAEELGKGLFSLADYADLLAEAAKRSARFHLARGALVEEGAVVSFTARLAAGARVYGGARVLGNSRIGENAEVCGGELIDSIVGARSKVRQSVLLNAAVGDNCTVGPYAYLRPGTVVGDGCRIGDFVELKNARVGNGCKISHLSYVGDATLGEKVNVGCGVVFANYDGRKKSRIEVGNRCFLGSNCNLVAPLRLGDGAFVAAGSTLTKDLQEDDLCIARAREVIKPNRGRKYYSP